MLEFQQPLKDLGLDEQSISNLWDKTITGVTTYGMDLLGAILVLVIGWWIAGKIQQVVEKGLSKIKNADPTLTGFISTAVRYVVLIVVIMAVLDRFGVQTTSLVAVLGAAGLAIGLALQGTLTNVAAGVMLLIFRPFRVGNYVEVAGLAGTVKYLGLFTTDLVTLQNLLIVVPNASIWGSPIINYSGMPKRRVDVPVGISYADSIDKAFAVLRECADRDPRVIKEDSIQIFVESLADSAVTINLRCFVKTSDYIQAKWDLTKAVKEGLDKAGIEIPFPQRTFHMAHPAKPAVPKKSSLKKSVPKKSGLKKKAAPKKTASSKKTIKRKKS